MTWPKGRHRGWLAAGLLGVCLATAGCWDRVEIQDRSFVLAAAVDVVEADAENEPGKARVESSGVAGSPPRYRVTLQVLRLGAGKAGEEKPGGETKTFLLSSTGRNVFEAERDMMGESSKAIWFENIQAVILSQAVVERYGLAAPLDLFRRDGEMRWRAQVFVTAGEARKILEVQLPTGEPGGIYLANVARRHKKDTYLAADRSDIGFATQAVDNNADMIFPVLEPVGKSLKIKGGAMFMKNKFLGYMDEYTIQGLRLFRGTEKSALISFECPLHPGNTVTFEVFRHDTILKARGEGENVYFTLAIAMRGNIGEIQCQHLHDTRSKEYRLAAQQLFAEEARRNIEHTLALAQRLGWESFYLRQTLQAFEPKTWEKIRDRWDELYPRIPVQVSVRVSVVNIGEHK